MLADLIAYLLHPRVRVFVDFTDEVQKRAAYIRRTADLHAADPKSWRWRVLAGEAVQRRVMQGNRKGKNILNLNRSRRTA